MLKNDEKWFQVSLRLTGDTLPIDKVSEKLQIEYSNIGRKGEHIKNNPRYAKYQTNIWGWTFTKDSAISFEVQIDEMLDVLEKKQAALKELLILPDVEGELFLGFSSANGQGGAHFSAALLHRIAALGLSVDLDLYPRNDVTDTETKS